LPKKITCPACGLSALHCAGGLCKRCYQAAKREKARQEGICIQCCSRPALPGLSACEECRAITKQWQQSNKPYFAEYATRRYRRGEVVSVAIPKKIHEKMKELSAKTGVGLVQLYAKAAEEFLEKNS